ncbi:hypothetical protein QMM_0477 [Clostridioides difficile DA00275]|nr:hypothetical protein QMI_0556 [Clostridioides difficile DA00261]EQH63276.1 hypothetical protein QMM_0477 [Clostridioides difficile DA00275]EQI71727.1 hypothetical protein QQC_0470 [Clostridioides difficile Y358]
MLSVVLQQTLNNYMLISVREVSRIVIASIWIISIYIWIISI